MKDGSIKVEIQSRIAGEEAITLLAGGRLFTQNGDRVLSYLEKDENGTIACRLTLCRDAVLLERRGEGVLFRARFAEKEKSESLYYAGGVEFEAVIKTEACRVTENEKRLELRLAYRMLLGEVERQVDFCLKATPKGEKNDG